VSEEIKVYSEEDLLVIAEDNTKELCHQLKSSNLNLGPDVEVRPTKKYIAFRRNKGPDWSSPQSGKDKGKDMGIDSDTYKNIQATTSQNTLDLIFVSVIPFTGEANLS
jgi:hypothetical protein